MRLLTLLPRLLVTIGTMSVASAQVVVTWNAANGWTPEEEHPAWILTLDGPTCGGSTAILGGGLLRLDNSSPCPSDFAAYGYGRFPQPFGQQTTFFIEGRGRVLSSAQSSVERGVTGIALAPPNYCPWILELDPGEVRLSWATLAPLGFAAVDTTSALRDYRLEVDTTTYSARVFVDGVLRISAPAPTFVGCSLPGVTQQAVFFGNFMQGESGVSLWESVTHNLAGDVDSFCTPAQLNSFGWEATVSHVGDLTIATNNVVLRAHSATPGSFGYFLCSRAYHAPIPLAGSQGTLCLGAPVGRFNRPGEILMVSNASSAELPIDLLNLPQPTGSVSAQAGESWHFQLWYRDANPAPTSNLSRGLRLTFE